MKRIQVLHSELKKYENGIDMFIGLLENSIKQGFSKEEQVNIFRDIEGDLENKEKLFFHIFHNITVIYD